MEFDSFVNSLRTFYRQRPFQHFEIELASGRVLRVEHPEALAFAGGRAVLISLNGDIHHIDHQGVVRVASLIEPATAPDSGA